MDLIKNEYQVIIERKNEKAEGSSIVVWPSTEILLAPKFTVALVTPGNCFTFFSNLPAQFVQLNPSIR